MLNRNVLSLWLLNELSMNPGGGYDTNESDLEAVEEASRKGMRKDSEEKNSSVSLLVAW